MNSVALEEGLDGPSRSKRLRIKLLPVPCASTASGRSNPSRVGFLLLLDQESLFTAHGPLHLFRNLP
jgi:hypothetical protein